MRPATFLSVALLLSAAVFAHTLFPVAATQRNLPQNLQTHTGARMSDGEPMVTRAYIEVVPLDLVMERNKQLEGLRSRVTQMQLEDMRLASARPEFRERLARETEVLNALLTFIEGERSDEGKSASAIEVKHHLNEIEGRMNCQACHAGLVDSNRRPAP